MAGTEQDEIEKIMSEIEELQKDITPEAPDAAPVSSISTEEEDLLKEIQAQAQSAPAGTPDSGLEETLADLKEEASAGGLLDEPTIASEAEEVSMSQNDSGNDGTLSLTLTGNMALKLKYEFEGQEVTISFVDQALRVQMTDGTEFKVPVIRGGAGSPGSNVKPFKKAV